MAAVLDLEPQPDDRRFPPVCIDEASTQRGGEVQVPLPAAPGLPSRVDDA